MSDRAETILAWLVGLPDWLVYLFVGLAAAVENVIPPVPGDISVVAGGVVAGAGGADPRLLFLVVWIANSASAMAVYAAGRHYGPAFVAGPVGQRLLGPGHLQALSIAYRRYGFPIIFFSRFLPVFRPVVPVFAGLARLGFWRTAVPILIASGVWYGMLVTLGAYAGDNWPAVLDFLAEIGRWFWIAAAALLALVLWWWWRTPNTIDDTNRR
jgi:membrane protein DedA with SNARE-associated domain